MASIDDIRSERLKKVELLREAGMDPYPAQSLRTNENIDFVEHFDSFEGKTLTLAGRIMSLRDQGGIVFIDLFDGTERIQSLLKKENINEGQFKLFLSAVDVGDFIEITGSPFVTKRGVNSLLGDEWRMLAKSIRPVPAEWFGIKDEDDRYRKRYLDILLNKDVADRARRRSMFWNSARRFFLERNYIEVETPVLETKTGGAEARPFTTHHNALNIDVFLRISAGELWQKKLMVGGLPKTFEIGRIFRNEGMSYSHAQDYTQLESYEAYCDYEKGKQIIIDLYRQIMMDTWGTLEFENGGVKIDFGGNWETYDFNQLMSDIYGFDPRDVTLESVKSQLDAHNIAYESSVDLGRGVDLLWKRIRKDISGPGFLVNIPVYLEPLAKKSREDEQVVERFQVIMFGTEMGKAFSELNDPVDQKERFDIQQALRDAGDEEAQMADYDYVEAMEYGMPPVFGFGVSERMFSFLEDVSIREAQLFPLMRPQSEQLSKKEAEARYRSKKFVVIADPSHGYGVTANALGQLGISIGGFSKEKLFDTETLVDADGRMHYVDGLYPMANLQGSHDQLVQFVMKCYEAGIQIFDFSDIMRKAHSDEQMLKGYAEKKTKEVGYIAVGALVPVEFEKEFLGTLELFK